MSPPLLSPSLSPSPSGGVGGGDGDGDDDGDDFCGGDGAGAILKNWYFMSSWEFVSVGAPP